MATTDKLITHEWVRITDGTKDQVIQFRGEIDICNSTTKPEPNAPALTFEDMTLTITKEDIAWVRTSSPDLSVILLIW